MIDLHTHTVFSDGVLIPAELAQRAKVAGYTAIAITDHADNSNLEHIIRAVRQAANSYSPYAGIDMIAGVELTHIPPGLLAEHIQRARTCGAQLVVVHGETIVEPVEQGTNLAAIEGGADILAHPGLITPEEVTLAAQKNVTLEISTRKGNSLTNGHVASLARKYGAQLVINNDAHAPGDFTDKHLHRAVALGAGLTEQEYQQARAHAHSMVQKIFMA